MTIFDTLTDAISIITSIFDFRFSPLYHSQTLFPCLSTSFRATDFTRNHPSFCPECPVAKLSDLTCAISRPLF